MELCLTGLIPGHGETDALENMGRVDAGVLRECAMFTTLSPCYMVSCGDVRMLDLQPGKVYTLSAGLSQSNQSLQWLMSCVS